MANGVIRNLQDRSLLIQAIRALSDKHIWVYELKKQTTKRTLSQNALYHKWIGIIAQEQGNDHDDQGQIMMKHLIKPTHYKKLPDGTEEPAWSTTKMDVPAMSNYMDALSRWAASEGCILPHPQDQHRR